MPRKPAKGYFVRGQFVAEGSPLDEQIKRERQDSGPSKTALKAQSADLQALGEQLLALRPGLRERLALPARLQDALAELARIHSFEGRRRQSQFVGKLMRQLDEPAIAAIRAALDEQQRGSAAETLLLHTAEAWRERLLASDEAMTDWLAEFPQTQAQPLRALVRQARKDAPAAASAGPAPRQGRAYRELFQWLRAELARGENP
ncbi:MAG: DUF615 domain-containing protein [Burkholderiaceae bacterium]|jgi:ribosome-associated protein|nr:DUF615 domain-containing protein [Burkholderiaceae bacterium]